MKTIYGVYVDYDPAPYEDYGYFVKFYFVAEYALKCKEKIEFRYPEALVMIRSFPVETFGIDKSPEYDYNDLNDLEILND